MYNTTPEALKARLSYSLPPLAHENCKLGLIRLRMMVEEPYVAVGYYFRNGYNIEFTYLDGKLDLYCHKHLLDTIWEALADQSVQADACGYFFVLPSDEEDCLQYTHFYMNLE